MANLLKHRFVSGKTDGPDTSQIQPSNWNDGHAFSGGNAGDVLTRDPADATYGATWGTGKVGYYEIHTAAPVVAAPVEFDRYLIVFDTPTSMAFHGLDPAPPATTFRRGARLQLLHTWVGSEITLVPNSSGYASYGRLINFSGQQGATRLGAGDASNIGGSAEYLWYPGSGWLMTAHHQGSPVSLGFTAGNFSGISATNIVSRYTLHGRDVHIFIRFEGPIAAAAPYIAIGPFPFLFYDVFSPFYPAAYANVGTVGGAGSWGPLPTSFTGDRQSLLVYQHNGTAWPGTPFQGLIDFTITIA